MSKNVWIFAEQRDGMVASSFYEMLSKVNELYGDTAQVSAVCFGGGELPAETLKDSGVDKVYAAAHEKLNEYNPLYYTDMLYKLICEEKPDVVLIAASAIGSEMAPGVAAKLRTGLAAHCTELELDGKGELAMIAPAFGGKLMGEYFIPNTLPVMASVKAGVFDKAELPSKNAQVVAVDTGFLTGCSAGLELVSRTVAQVKEQPLENAERVVCVGLGISGAENLDKARKLAAALKASLGYTRPMVDMGYMENESAMIGSSGKMIKPKLYIGFGISGSTQHVCGMKDSGIIINVNTNEKADIFSVSNYKIVGDSGAFLDELLKLL